ncbi:MAG: hypothetical protein PHV37_06240 [Candidatus Gastranaerophilales bacterium]|nr:hypothetical protein [Candidatus Gastranaerophilales bacterium]
MINPVSINSVAYTADVKKKTVKNAAAGALIGAGVSTAGLARTIQKTKMPLKEVIAEFPSKLKFLTSTTIPKFTAIGAAVGAGITVLAGVLAKHKADGINKNA